MQADIKISPENLLPWSYMEDWENGTSSAPTEHVLSGAGASIAQESSIVKHGTYSAKLTRSGTNCAFYYDLPNYQDYIGKTVIFGAWVYATVASRARILVSDGTSSSNSFDHSGNGSWEWLEVTPAFQVTATAANLRCQFQVNTGDTSAYFDGGILCEGDNTFTVLTDYVDVQSWSARKKILGKSYGLTRRDGSKIPRTQYDELMIKSKMLAIGATATAARTNSDTVIKALSGFRNKPDGDTEQKDLFLFNDRYLRVHSTGSIALDYQPGLISIPIDASFVAPEPYYNYINKTRSATTINTSPKTFSITTAGTAIVRPYITLTAGAANITATTIENLTTGQSFSYSGTITSAQDLTWDADILTVENNGTDDLGNSSGDRQLILVPGINNMKVTITGGSTDSVIRVDYRDRWA